jgi:hypothetical protein
MGTDERIALGVLAVALVALIVFNVRGVTQAERAVAATEATPAEPTAVTGPEYLTYNAPWGFSPPIYNMLPKRTAGMIGQVAAETPHSTSTATALNCGCG